MITICCLCNKEMPSDPNETYEVASLKPFQGLIACEECKEKRVKTLAEWLEYANPNSKEKTKALLIKEKPDKTITLIKPIEKYFQLKELQQAVGGYIELVIWKLQDYIIVVNEEGSYKKGLNPTASELFNMKLYGDILICPNEIFEKPEEDDGDA